MNDKKFTEGRRDILKELGNIGSGNAVTALSQMLGERLELCMPQCSIVQESGLGGLIKDKNSMYVGVVLNVSGDLQSMIALLLNKEFASMVLERLVGDKDVDVQQLDEMQKSAICEIGNIMCNSYYTAMSSMLGRTMNVSVPYMLVDTGERILQIFTEKYMQKDEEMIFVKNTFFYNNQELESHILLHPSSVAVAEMLEKLEA